jgi:hypothetical protein
MACEFGVFMFFRWRRGQLVPATAQPASSIASVIYSSIIGFFFYAMMSIAPWVQLRNPQALGGRVYFWMIV